MPAHNRFDTHEVFNQSPPLVDVNLFAIDAPLRDAVAAYGAASQSEALAAFGARWGSAEMAEQARLANENPPKLKTFDAKGYRRDTVEFHPAYHHFMAQSISDGLHAMTWRLDGTRAAAPSEVARGARFYMAHQIEAGHLCPITMTRASIAALAAEPALAQRLMPTIISRHYDPSFKPFWEKFGMTLGMGMTEKQGGSDVRANATRAVPVQDGYVITGHKWFMSAPMCDAFLVLAQAPGGLTCFLMPRFRPDGSVNDLRFQRLKDKVGNRSNASSEVEFLDAFAWRVGEEGRGVRTIIDMVQTTRVDCALGSAGLMRMALSQAIHHVRHRSAFQRRLADQPMMRTVLADLALEIEAATAAVLRLCHALDQPENAAEAAYARLLTPVIKYWVCKTAPGFVYETMECLGGNGYVEEGVLARFYREAPLNAIWEGCGNVMCLDVLRALDRDAEAARSVFTTLAAVVGDLPGMAGITASLGARLFGSPTEAEARALVEQFALIAALAALAKCAPDPITAAFASTRLRGRLRGYGTADLDRDLVERLLDRALQSS